jgi:hypothetical protein
VALVSRTHAAATMYDEYSFVRNAELTTFAYRILSICNQFTFKLEHSLTLGIHY